MFSRVVMSSMMKTLGRSEKRRVADDKPAMTGLHLMDNVSLASAVLDMARRVRKISGNVKDPRNMTATDDLTHRVIPALALRINPDIRLDPVERASIESYRSEYPVSLETSSGDDLRRHAGGMIRRATTPSFMGAKSDFDEDLRLLSRPIEEGNPAALLLDRIAPEPEGPVSKRSLVPTWSPDAEQRADSGFWLMGRGPDSEPFPIAYYDDLEKAQKDLEDIEVNGLGGNDAALKKISEAGAVDGDEVKLIVLTGRGAAISHTVGATLGRDDRELSNEDNRMSM